MPDLNDYALAVTVCGGFRWLDGMMAIDGPPENDRLRIALTSGSGAAMVVDLSNVIDLTTVPLHRCRPDLTDPATIGCIESLVRERVPGAVLAGEPGGWYVLRYSDHGLMDDAPAVVRRETGRPSFRAVGVAWAAALIAIDGTS